MRTCSCVVAARCSAWRTVYWQLIKNMRKSFSPCCLQHPEQVNTAYTHSYYQERSLTLTFDLRQVKLSNQHEQPACPPSSCLLLTCSLCKYYTYIRWALRDQLWEDKVGELFLVYGLYWSGYIFMLTESNNKTALLQFSCVPENFNYMLLSEDKN